MSYLKRFAKRFFSARHVAAPGLVAKERLEQALLQDRLDADPQRMAGVKSELLDTLARYFELDRACADVYLSTDGKRISLVANVPVSKCRRCLKSGEGESL